MIVLLCLSLLVVALPAFLFWRNMAVFAPPPFPPTNDASDVSILIPARNEARNISEALRAASRNHVGEILVLDDCSTDETANLVTATGDPRVRLIEGREPPPTWAGKNFACFQLAREARGRFLLFVDADVRLGADAAARLRAELERHQVDLTSGLPLELTGSFLEHLLVPVIHFVLFGFLPLTRMRSSSYPAYATGCGQLAFARSAAYHRSGGHALFRDRLHDGLELPRAFRRAGFRTDLCDTTTIASCRMYHNAGEVWRGLLKNAHEGLGSPARILPTTAIVALTLAPFVAGCFFNRLSAVQFLLASAAIGLAYFPRVLAAFRFRQRWSSVLLQPFALLLLLVLQWIGFIRWLIGRPVPWKGRRPRRAAGPIHSGLVENLPKTTDRDHRPIRPVV